MYRIDGNNPVKKVKYTEMKEITLLFHTQTKHNTHILLKNVAQDRIIGFKFVQVGGWGDDYMIAKSTFFINEDVLSLQ